MIEWQSWGSNPVPCVANDKTTASKSLPLFLTLSSAIIKINDWMK